ncbi:hypothetical protein H1R20_g3205, partial [Candolleomyces eurysporus]
MSVGVTSLPVNGPVEAVYPPMARRFRLMPKLYLLPNSRSRAKAIIAQDLAINMLISANVQGRRMLMCENCRDSFLPVRVRLVLVRLARRCLWLCLFWFSALEEASKAFAHSVLKRENLRGDNFCPSLGPHFVDALTRQSAVRIDQEFDNQGSTPHLLYSDISFSSPPGSRSPESEMMSTEEQAFVNDIPPIWISENAEIVPGPAPGERTAMLTVDGEVIIDESDYDAFNSVPSPESDGSEALRCAESDNW